jgi:hypothetical protein
MYFNFGSLEIKKIVNTDTTTTTIVNMSIHDVNGIKVITKTLNISSNPR